MLKMRHVLGQHCCKLALVEDQHPIQQLAGTVPIHRSAIAFARGACTGVRRTWMASLANTASNMAVNFAVAIPDEEPEPSRAVAKVDQQVAGLLDNPGSGRVRGDAQQVHAAGGMLDDEQNIEPVPQQRIDAKEVRGENAVCLGAQELPPAGPVAARGGIQAGSLQNRPHRARRKPITQASKLTVDPAVAPGRVLRR